MQGKVVLPGNPVRDNLEVEPLADNTKPGLVVHHILVEYMQAEPAPGTYVHFDNLKRRQKVL